MFFCPACLPRFRCAARGADLEFEGEGLFGQAMGKIGNVTVRTLTENIAIVLVAPKYPENIGAAARVAANMGISRLIVVAGGLPDPEQTERMQKTATHHVADLLEKIEVYETLAEALSSFTWVVGTSARQGRKRSSISTPRQIARDIVPLLKSNQIAVLFGPEDRGLTNDDLKYCNQISTIPTADFSSLNLAQAVAILCYEIYTCLREEADKKLTRYAPKRVETKELEATYAQVEKVLRSLALLKETDLNSWMHNVRKFLGRIGLRAKEAKVIRGFCRQLFLYDQRLQGPKERKN